MVNEQKNGESAKDLSKLSLDSLIHNMISIAVNHPNVLRKKENIPRESIPYYNLYNELRFEIRKRQYVHLTD